MNSEKTPERNETPEQLPSQEQIRSAFETILGHANYAELLLRSDSGGVHSYEVQVTLENGEKREYSYERATYDYRDPSLPNTAWFSGSIHVTEYDSTGMPVGGQCVANYRDGIWRYVPYQDHSG